MVLTRLSHIGETCPLSDHSYSDSPSSSSIPGTLVSTSRGHITNKSENGDSQEKEKCKTVVEVHTATHLHILELPNEILEKIFSSLTFKNLGDLRCVCKRFDKVSSNILNTTFQKLQNQMLVRFQETKSQMPRRESARRKHPLARESDILEMLHMRLTLLQMTFGKHIERKNCCFFAAEILDEVHRILRCIKATPNMGKVFKITDELFDLSTMAMEYFKEFIEPGLPEISYFNSDLLDMHNRYSESEDEPDPIPQSSMVLRKRIRKIRQGMKRYNSQLTIMKRELRNYKNRIAEQNKQMGDYAVRMEEYDKKFDEASRKFNTVLQEVNRCKTELQYWRSRSPVQSLVCNCHCNCSRSQSTNWGVEELIAGTPSTVGLKNLQPLFDDHPIDWGAPSSSFMGTPQGPPAATETPHTPATQRPEESSNKRNSTTSSEEDESDGDVDTVGQRVKQRKRIKIL